MSTPKDQAATGAATAAAVRTARDYVGGQWVDSNATRWGEVHNPATAEVIARTPLGGASDVERAVRAAQAAFPAWRATPPVQRARYLFKLKHVMEERFEDLARVVTLEHGKTLDESRSSVRRAIENVEIGCAIPMTMQGAALEDIASGIDCESIRQPMGVFAAITPFNFPAMVPLWFLPHAIALGNTFVVKPSERVPLSQQVVFEMLHAVGLPPGVVNLVNGAREVVDALLDHPGVCGYSFVGSTPVAHHIYMRAAEKGKRAQALGGAKNFVLVMPDADLGKACEVSIDSAFGCAGERCLANSAVIAVGDCYPTVREGLLARARAIKVGDGMEPGVTMGPVISAQHRDKILGYIETGLKEGAKLILDGRGFRHPKHPDGYWLGPCIFDEVTPDMVIAREEIFGPVLCLMRAKDFDEACAVVNGHPQGNASSIFTTSGKWAREFRYRVAPSMLGINIGVAAPMAFFPFGGTKASFFGDVKAHGRECVDFFTDKKVVISRW
ncbi:MAG: CoA-acylating methylmalonate-semialdehyde dehydrogenase [Candidatus Eisenbacteria bacterium]|nr:CoA-acylating methylmalonate-semialdehyde dehydrogenase [Candidatus Eisenbacteria bacterium]